MRLSTADFGVAWDRLRGHRHFWTGAGLGGLCSERQPSHRPQAASKIGGHREPHN